MIRVFVTAPNFEDFYLNEDISPMQNVWEDCQAWIVDPRKQVVIPDGFEPKIIATPSTGTNHIDLEDMERRGIKVLSLKDNQEALNTITASSEFTLQLLLEAFRSQRKEISGKRITLVGFGRIGRNMARYLRALHAPFTTYDPHVFVNGDSLEHKVANSDAMVICCTLNDETRGMINADVLKHAKEDYIIVNTARGAVVHNDSMKSFLWSNGNALYFTDVPYIGGETLLPMPDGQYKYTGHIAGDTTDSNKKAADIILDLVRKELGK